jgi:hypothetical protein
MYPSLGINMTAIGLPCGVAELHALKNSFTLPRNKGFDLK